MQTLQNIHTYITRKKNNIIKIASASGFIKIKRNPSYINKIIHYLSCIDKRFSTPLECKSKISFFSSYEMRHLFKKTQFIKISL